MRNMEWQIITTTLPKSNGKALVMQIGDMFYLKSYNTIVAAIKQRMCEGPYGGYICCGYNKYRTRWTDRMKFTQTTSRHIKMFFENICGHYKMTKEEYLALPVIEDKDIPVG